MKKKVILYRGIFIILISLLFACAQKKVEPELSVYEEIAAPDPVEIIKVAEVWQPLVSKLNIDGFTDYEISFFFAQLDETHSQDPMGKKIRELYGNTFKQKKAKPTTPKKITTSPAIYDSVKTESTIELCRSFLLEHEEYFNNAETIFGVKKEVVVSLLFVETRLGDYLGKENPLYTLASMALSNDPLYIESYLPMFPEIEKKPEWIYEKLEDKSNWAYRELKSLIQYSIENNLNPVDMNGSMYGAIGLCQFMPSNIIPYGADGDSDGIIDLFNPADAIASASNYLQKHGWKNNSKEAQVKALKRYNNLNIYANSILALASKI